MGQDPSKEIRWTHGVYPRLIRPHYLENDGWFKVGYNVRVCKQCNYPVGIVDSGFICLLCFRPKEIEETKSIYVADIMGAVAVRGDLLCDNVRLNGKKVRKEL